jgi:hypothetical protein
MNHTLTYDSAVKGWTSFFTYYPDWMVGMNQFFYTFKGGNLYRHNVNPVRNNFYGQPGTSSVTTVFNQSPIENKLFKTISLEGNSAWNVNMYTDIQDGGNIDADWFEKKEQVWYAYIRNDNNTPVLPDQYPLRSLNGIGRNESVSVVSGNIYKVSFPAAISIGDIISVGDSIYWTSSTTAPISITYGGIVQSIVVNPPDNYLTIDVQSPAQTPAAEAFIMFAKNSVAESHGLLGHYAVIELTNSNTTAAELFVVKSEIMKSFP